MTPANLARLLAIALLLGGCAAAATPTTAPQAAATTPRPSVEVPAEPRPPASPTPATTVDGWAGTVVKLCGMAQFDDYFQRDDGVRFGISGATTEVEVQVEEARCQPGTVIRVWGTLDPETMDVQGRQIMAERVEVVSAPPTPEPEPGPGQEPVEGWLGHIIPLCRHDHLDNYFERDDGVRFGIYAPPAPGEPQGAVGPTQEALYIAECEGYPIRIWGTLHKGVDDYRGTQIVVERIEQE